MATANQPEQPRWMADFVQALDAAAQAAVDQIDHALSAAQGPVPDAMRYAVRGGKALRAFLVCEGAHLHGVSPEPAYVAAGAIEAIHAYSLIHDDLPCMDDDDLRRGQPTVHRKWDETTAVLAGDALQALAFEMLAATMRPAEMMHSLAVASGVRGMVGGQALDIAAETAKVPLTLDQIQTLQKGKTGALITWSAVAGPRMAGDDITALNTYGDALGLAFQIADDILDIEGTAAEVGKAVGKDASAGKATFVSLLGLDGAKTRAAQLVAEACDALSCYGAEAATLKDAAQFVTTRRK